MRTIIDRVLFLVITLAVAILAGTAAPVLLDRPMEGTRLLVHVTTSGVLVAALPVYAVWFLGRVIVQTRSHRLQRIAYWVLILAGATAMITMLISMLPITPVWVMTRLFQIHAYAGFAMVPALVVLALGNSRWRRIHAIRSATPG